MGRKGKKNHHTAKELQRKIDAHKPKGMGYCSSCVYTTERVREWGGKAAVKLFPPSLSCGAASPLTVVHWLAHNHNKQEEERLVLPSASR